MLCMFETNFFFLVKLEKFESSCYTAKQKC